MTLKEAANLKSGTIIYELDSIFGPHMREVTLEQGHTYDYNDPFISLDYLVKRHNIFDKVFYPCSCFFKSYNECRIHEMCIYDYM